MSNEYKQVQSANINIGGITIVQPAIYYDNRGENIETFSANYHKMMFSVNDNFRDSLTEPGKTFIVDSVSISTKNVIRGMHGDTKTWKLVQCLKGSIYIVVLDVRKDSPTYRQYDKFYINDKNRWQILIPPGCVNGHLCLSNECMFHYKLTEEYTPQEDQISIKWDDPEYNISWPISKTNAILSDRDR